MSLCSGDGTGASYTDGSLGVFHGPRKLATYDADGNLRTGQGVDAASVGQQSDEKEVFGACSPFERPYTKKTIA